MIRRTATWETAFLFALALLTVRGGVAQAPSFPTLHSFKGGADGASPNGVTLAANGALYGTTFTGGTHTCGNYLCGTVFELAPAKGAAWTKTVLYNFHGADGASPSPGGLGVFVHLLTPGPSPVFGSNGMLYGTTAAGGSNAPAGFPSLGGTVFELAPPTIAGGVWTETVLYNLGPGTGVPNTPLGAVLIDPRGVLYGTAYSNYYEAALIAQVGGSVFTLTPPAVPGGSWTERTLAYLYPFNSLGGSPIAGIVSVGGSFYGTMECSSIGGCGSAYELTPPAAGGGKWTGRAIHNFAGAGAFGDDGCYSVAPLTVAPGGVLYGTTFSGGANTCPYDNGGCGTVFQLTPPATTGGAWTETVIYKFTGFDGDGAYPTAGVVLGKNGALYGTTAFGGSATSGPPCSPDATGCGTVFQLTPPATPGSPWTETILHSFTGQNGEGSIPGPLTQGPTGVLYGPTWTGGTEGKGTVFALEP